MGSLDRNLALSLHSGSGLLVEGEEVSEWIEIIEYDSLKEKPKYAAFLFKKTEPSREGGMYLPATVQLVRHFGSRQCTHYHAIEDIPK